MQFGYKCCDNEPNQRINVGRFIVKLDEFLNKNDMSGAERCLNFWADEAVAMCDKRGLLSVVNEQIGFYRRVGNKEKATLACRKAMELLSDAELDKTVSGEVIAVNVATTLGAYGFTEEAMEIYDRAEKVFIDNNAENTYEYAAFVNNKASTQYVCGLTKQAESNYLRAIDLLRKEKNHLYDIAVSCCALAELYQKLYNDDEKSLPMLDEAWTVLCDENIIRDGNYAFALTKCYPVFERFGQNMQAEALHEIADEIYGENK